MDVNQIKKNASISNNTRGNNQLSKIQMINKFPKVSNYFRGELLDKKEININNKLKETETEINKPKLLTQFYPEAFNVKVSKDSSKEKKLTSPNKKIEKHFHTKIKKKSEEHKKTNNYFSNEDVNSINNQSLNNNYRLSDYNRYKKNLYNNKNTIKNQMPEDVELRNFNITNNDENKSLKEKDKQKINIKGNFFNKSNLNMSLTEKNQNNKRKCSDDIISNKNHNHDSLILKNEIKNNNNRNSSNDKIKYGTNKIINYEKNAINTYNNINTEGIGNNFFNTKTYSNNFSNKINDVNDNIIQDYYPRKISYKNKTNNKLMLRPIIPTGRKISDDLIKYGFSSQYIVSNNSNNSNNLKEKLKFDKTDNILKNLENIQLLDEKNEGIDMNRKTLNEFLLLNNNTKLKKEVENINEGISFNFFNGYKYYFSIRNVDIYFLKEVKYSLAKGVSISIKNWNKEYSLNEDYLKIIGHKLNEPKGHCTYIIEYPRKGENLYNIINSTGFISRELFLLIVNKIYECIMNIKGKSDEQNKDYVEIPFCLCDIFISAENKIKLMPPIIRKISINSSDNDPNNLLVCKCKKNYKILSEIITKNNTSFFCLGFAILQLITQNLIFEIKAYTIFIKLLEDKDQINQYKKCCLLHSLLFIEDKICNNKNDILISKFLNIFDYENKLEIFIHELTLFNSKNLNIPKNNFTYNNRSMIDLNSKELFKMIDLSNVNYISLENFLKNFNEKFLEINLKNEENNYFGSLKENKILNVIQRYYFIDKDRLKNKMKNIILKNDYYREENVNNYINNKNYNYSSFIK